MLNNCLPPQLGNMIMSSGNPMAFIQKMFANHPKYGQVMQIVQSKNPQELEQYVRNVYKNQNVNLAQMASQFGLNIQ